jgi:hypothetical protein
LYGVDAPLLGDAFERVGSAVVEGDVGSRDKIHDGLRNENFAWLCDRADTSSDVSHSIIVTLIGFAAFTAT